MQTYSILFLRLCIGGIFAFAGIAKAMSLFSFEVVLRNFDLVPQPLTSSLAMFITAAETLLGIALIVGFQTRRASLLIGFMCAGFVIVIGINLLQGNDLECGCFGEFIDERVLFGLLFRDSLLSFASFIMSKRRTFPFSIDEWLGGQWYAGK